MLEFQARGSHMPGQGLFRCRGIGPEARAGSLMVKTSSCRCQRFWDDFRKIAGWRSRAIGPRRIKRECPHQINGAGPLWINSAHNQANKNVNNRAQNRTSFAMGPQKRRPSASCRLMPLAPEGAQGIDPHKSGLRRPSLGLRLCEAQKYEPTKDAQRKKQAMPGNVSL